MKNQQDIMLFPHSRVRKIQDKLITEVYGCLTKGKNLIVHAPTGLGKTAATLAPALSVALEKKLTVFFLTSRQTQHVIAVDTLRKIQKRHGVKFSAVDIIGKKWMCPAPGTDMLYSSEFSEYCKSQRENDRCEFFRTTREGSKLSVEAAKTLDELKAIPPQHSEQLMEICREKGLCAYEMATVLARHAAVVVADYYYIFSQAIRDGFFSRTGKELEKSIIIIDEGHNLASRARDLLTQKISSLTIRRAIKEAKKYGLSDVVLLLSQIQDVLNQLSRDIEIGEKLVSSQEFAAGIGRIRDYDEVISELEFAADSVREAQKRSVIGGISLFLESWRGDDTGFARIISVQGRDEPIVSLSYRCLDPSIVTRPVFENCHSSIIMSGTLLPTEMYKNILGFPEDTGSAEYQSPFPKKNKLSLVIPKTTTRFTSRSEAQYRDIAGVCADIANAVPGNVALFFPSYGLRDSVGRYFSRLCLKTTFNESQRASKEDKMELLSRFSGYRASGAVLMGATSGSFGEGIDLPGDLLKAVVIVGLPLQPPDLETKQLMKYYEERFGKGWDYGYILPAISKCFQNAGRCIRSEKDRGVVVFLDERYATRAYLRCFPRDETLIITTAYKDEIHAFFNKQG
ncbi:MAG: ATP-dependent DNA helicase [archaeon]